MATRKSAQSPSRHRQQTATVSEASTFLESPSPSQHPDDNQDSGTSNAVGMPSTGVRARKRQRRHIVTGNESHRGQLLNFARRLPAVLSDPELVMQVSTITTVSGGFCLLLAVFSGPVVVFLAVVVIGMYGMAHSIRQRGALQLLPSGVVELLTRTTLLDFLTDTSVFDAIKTYLVFMMGLSPEETHRVLHTLPENMQVTLTRAGLMHTLPMSVQSLLLPDRSVSVSGQNRLEASRANSSPLLNEGHVSNQASRRCRRRRRVGGSREQEGVVNRENRGPDGVVAEGGRTRRRRDEEAEDDTPLGLLVWNPLPVDGLAPQGPPDGDFNEGDRDVNRASNDGSSDGDDHEVGDGDGENNSENESDVTDGNRNDHGDEEEHVLDDDNAESVSGDDAILDDADDASDADEDLTRRPLENNAMDARNGSIRRPWDSTPRPHQGPRFHRSNSDAIHAAQGAESLAVAAGGRRRAVSSARGTEGGAIVAGVNPYSAAASQNVGMVPSAERIVASILQSRVDKAVMAAWNVIDQRRLRRAAVGSGVALAAHMVLSQRARRQASAMLRGSVLAALAGTATFCAGLAHLNPVTRGHDDADASTSGPEPTAPTAREEAPSSSRRRWYGGSDDEPLVEAGIETENQERSSWLTSRRLDLRRWITRLTPSAQRLIRILGIVCLLLAIRKWQMLRRAAMRATRPRMYGSLSP